MTKGALITIFQLQYVGCIKTFQRVATQILEPGPYSPAFCFLLTFQVFLVPKFSDQGFAFMGFFDFRAGTFEIVKVQQIQSHLRTQPDFLVVMAFIAADFVVDQKTGELCEVPGGIEPDRLLPGIYQFVSVAPCLLACSKVALCAQ